MSETINEDVLETPQDELSALKARADLLGISYHPSIGLKSLRDKVNAAVEGEEEAEETPVVATATDKEETPAAKRLRVRNEALSLVRIRVTCMNPNKKEWEGEIITAGNNAVGTVKKYVPFNAVDGWHVPKIIFQQLARRKCQVFTTVRNPKGGSYRQGKLIKEFAIEVLPPLTEKELTELARRQAMAKGTD
jgi:hypothetical protein